MGVYIEPKAHSIGGLGLEIKPMSQSICGLDYGPWAGVRRSA